MRCAGRAGCLARQGNTGSARPGQLGALPDASICQRLPLSTRRYARSGPLFQTNEQALTSTMRENRPREPPDEIRTNILGDDARHPVALDA